MVSKGRSARKRGCVGTPCRIHPTHDSDAAIVYANRRYRWQGICKRTAALQIDEILVTGGRATAQSPTPPAPLSLEKRQRYWRMLKLSVYAKSLEVDPNAYGLHDPAEGDLVEWMMGYAVVQKGTELEKLYLQYANDLTDFEAFLEAKASQHLFAAMTKAIANAHQRMKQIEDGVWKAENDHEAEWRSLFKAEATQ